MQRLFYNLSRRKRSLNRHLTQEKGEKTKAKVFHFDSVTELLYTNKRVPEFKNQLSHEPISWSPYLHISLSRSFFPRRVIFGTSSVSIFTAR